MRHSITRHAGEQGFTLLELLIAVILATIVLAAGYTVFESSNRAAMQQNMDNRMQDNARVAMDVIARNFRRAGFLANFESYPISWSVDNSRVKLVTGNSTSAPDEVTVVGGTLISAGTLVNSVPGGANQLTVTDASAIHGGDIIGLGLTFSGRVEGDPVGNTITLDTTVPTGATNMAYPGEFLEDGSTLSQQHPAPVRLLTKVRYYIDSSDPKHPVLMQTVRDAVTEPVAEDIEDFQIKYGVDLNKNRIIEESGGEWINAPTAAQIDLIRLVRITIVARSSQPDRALIGIDQTVPSIEDRPQRTQIRDGYRRYILSRVVKTRNIDVLFTL